ncbi:unnamed protein product, partial [Ceratitis capitata]
MLILADTRVPLRHQKTPLVMLGCALWQDGQGGLAGWLAARLSDCLFVFFIATNSATSWLAKAAALHPLLLLLLQPLPSLKSLPLSWLHCFLYFSTESTKLDFAPALI